MTTYIDLPTNPEEIGVTIPSASLRSIDFTALEFESLMQVTVEYMNTYYKTEFNDFVNHNGVMMLVDLVAFVASRISERSDIMVKESFLSTAITREAVENHLNLINESIKSQTPAIIEVHCSLIDPISVPIYITAGTTFSTTGMQGDVVTYEIYKAPGDFINDIIIQPTKRGVVAYGIEGSMATPFSAISTGSANQILTLLNTNILSSPFIVKVGGIEWTEVDVKEKYTANAKIYEVTPTDAGVNIIFGDDVNGKAPTSGETITVHYRTGGGVKGRIGAGYINETRSISPTPPANIGAQVTFFNPSPSSGGYDIETLEDAKKRAPLDAAIMDSVTSGSDYAQAATTYSHPVYGSALKAVATVRTSLNANIVEIYILTEGAINPAKPSIGLKEAMAKYFNAVEENTLTDEVRILDGELKTIDLDITIFLDQSMDSAVAKNGVDKALEDFFSLANFDMGAGLYLSQLTKVIQEIDGISRCIIYKPIDDILPTNQLANLSSFGVGLNELIVIGTQKVDYYYE